MEPMYSSVPLAEVGNPDRPGSLLQQVHLLYRSQFVTWFGITAPTSVLASVVILVADRRIKEVFRGMPRGEIQFHLGDMAGMLVLRFGSFFISWLLGCFALAAIATLVGGRNNEGDDSDGAWKHDGHQRAREHFGAILVAAFVTFLAFLAGMVGAAFLEFAATRLVGWSHFSRFIYLATVGGYIVVASIVSWLGMTIPLILEGNTTVWLALKKSVELSGGHEGALFLLVVESVLGSYLAWYATSSVLAFLLPDHLKYAVWYSWLVYGVAVLATAAVEPPIFIGFSLLANPEFNPRSFPLSQQTT